jgi:hypothetical protein
MIDSDAAGPGLDVDDVAPGQRPGAHAGRKGELGVHEVWSVEQRSEPSAGRDGPRRGALPPLWVEGFNQCTEQTLENETRDTELKRPLTQGEEMRRKKA